MPNRRLTSSCSETGLSPSIEIAPLVGRSIVVSIWMVVVLPAPFGPRKAKISPARTWKEISSTARRVPKTFTKPWTWIIDTILNGLV